MTAVRMTSPSVSLLQHLLTRSDLERLAIPAEQITEWLSTGAVATVAELPNEADTAEQVLSVADEDLSADLVGRLAEIGKPAVLLRPGQLHSFARITAEGEPAADVAAQLARAIADVDGDLENIVRLALEADGSAAIERQPVAQPAHGSQLLDDSEVTEILRGTSTSLPDSNIGAWFRDEPSGSERGVPLDDLVPLAGEDLEELSATVAFHSEQFERLVDLPLGLESLAREVAHLRATLEAAGLAVPEPGDAGESGTPPSDTAPLPHSRRTALVAICIALLCWTGLVWFGTGSAALALTSFAAANVVGYLALQPTTWRR